MIGTILCLLGIHRYSVPYWGKRNNGWLHVCQRCKKLTKTLPPVV